MRYFFLAVLLWALAAHRAEAQRPLPAGRPDSLLATPPAPDTAAAIHRLFAAKRKRQVIISSATFGAAVGAVAVVVATSNQQPSGGGGNSYGNIGPILDGPAVAVVGVSVIALPVVLIEAILFGGWSKKQEQQTMEAWQQHKEVRFLRRKLKPKYFALPPPPK